MLNLTATTEVKTNRFLIRALQMEAALLDGYELAVEKIEDDGYREQIRQFCADHRHNLTEIKDYYQHNINQQAQTHGAFKSWLIRGNIRLAALFASDVYLLKTLLGYEINTLSAYRRVLESAGPAILQDSNPLYQAIKITLAHIKHLQKITDLFF